MESKTTEDILMEGIKTGEHINKRWVAVEDVMKFIEEELAAAESLTESAIDKKTEAFSYGHRNALLVLKDKLQSEPENKKDIWYEDWH